MILLASLSQTVKSCLLQLTNPVPRVPWLLLLSLSEEKDLWNDIDFIFHRVLIVVEKNECYY